MMYHKLEGLTIFTGLTLILFFLFAFNLNFLNISTTSLLGLASAFNIETLNNWRSDGGFTRELALGDKGVDVSYLETFLKTQYPGQISQIDNTFGTSTVQALQSFQKNNELSVTGSFDSATKKKINALLTLTLCPEGNQADPDTLLLPVSKTLSVDKNYAPPDLVVLPETDVTNGIICLRKDAADAYNQMVGQALEDGIVIGVTSGFRKFEMQEYLFNLYSQSSGIAYASRVSALPGHSEHQLGTAVDLTGGSIGYTSTDHNFGNTREGKWLQAHAGEYGFVMSYPKGKESITGYAYEPWHYRYIGSESANAIQLSDTTEKEYLESIEDIDPNS